ncbi:uncharacterized protein [Leptinotarsa decemlineata]|uniref:uncharacterized protein n=1 Tax=Leptinotarsa decemlineata TaxID=7539 RepID=UPI003D305C34
MFYRACAILYTMAALIPNGQSAPGPVSDSPSISPCAAFFNYESAEKPGERTGNLLAKSEENLYGVWIRLIFDRDVEKVVVAGFDVVSPEGNPREVLVKNRNELLKEFQPLSLKITMFYKGDQPPALLEYRLNAKRICSASNTLPTDLFEGDTNSERFLAELQTNSKHTIPEQPYKCGIETNPTKKQYPWKASLSYNHLNSTKPICQATLISPSHLITPAHCVTSMKEGTAVPSDSLLVHLGKEDQVKLSDVVVHPGYQAGFLDHGWHY